MTLPEFSLGLLDRDHPLSADGHAVYELHADGRRIETLEDLNALHVLFDAQAIILIKRAAISDVFMRTVQPETDRFSGDPNDLKKGWNKLGTSVPTNAVPHIHDYRNWHAAPTPSESSTAFFARQSVIKAARDMAVNRRYPFDIREFFQEAIMAYMIDGDEKSFFRALHVSEPSRDGWLPVLHAVRDLQKRVADDGGMVEADLGPDGYGIVSIPAHGVHGRDTTKHLMRDPREQSSFRFYGDPIL